jgi:hypothetical protein
MPKTYLCTKIFDGKECGETNPENFPSGRYSVCKKCKNKEMTEIRKKKKQDNVKERLKKIDPELDFKKLIENQPVFHKNKTVKEGMKILLSKINELEFKLIEMRDMYNRNIQQIYTDIERLNLRVPHK